LSKSWRKPCNVQSEAYDILSDNWKEAFSDAVLEIEAKCRFKKINENSKGD